MAYIGNTPADGEFKKADAISSTFNGVLTQFNIDYGTIQQSIGDPSQLIVSLNGVIQEPLTAYTLGIGGGSIIFASAPVSGDTCHIVILGGVGGTITPSDNSVTASKLSPSLKDFLEQNFVANGSQTTYTLSRAATGANTLLLSIDGILQPSSAFSVSGTTLTIDPALPNTTNVRVVHLGVVAGVYVPAPDSVTADMIANSINADIATGVAANTTANAALPKAGGAMTGPITTNSTFDGVDVGVRDGILTSTTTTANAALPKAGGTMTGVIAGFTSTGIDDNATSTAVTIDASENVLVGKTTIAGAFNTVGSEIRASGLVQSTVDGSKCIDLNRLSSDGDILGFSKAGTSVGSIGVDGGDNLYITGQTGNTGGIYMNDAAVSPAYQGAERDNYYNLGKAPARWKDLYLSGGVYLGGTGTANKLDDYEEGTWTPSAYGGFSSLTLVEARYVKIGSQVTVVYYLGATSGNNSSHFIIGGLPFTVASNMYSTGWIGSGAKVGYFRAASGGSRMEAFRAHETTGNRELILGNNMAGNHVLGSLTYITDQ